MAADFGRKGFHELLEESINMINSRKMSMTDGKMSDKELLQLYQNIIVKLVRCISKVDKKSLKTVIIGFMDREETPASSNPPSFFAKYLKFDGQDSIDKWLLTSIEIRTELLDRAKNSKLVLSEPDPDDFVDHSQ